MNRRFRLDNETTEAIRAILIVAAVFAATVVPLWPLL